MLHIGICDFSESNRNELQRLLTLALFSTTEYTFHHFKDGYELLQAYGQHEFHLDLLFLEIALPRINGLVVAAALRKKRVPVDLVFITELKQYVYEGYVYHAYDFLVKPASAKTVGKMMQRYIEERLARHTEFINVYVQGSRQSISLAHVLYFESRKRKIAAVMEHGELEFDLTMDELAECLAEAEFIRCHRSYFVNVRYISQVQFDRILMSDGEQVPVSRSYLKQIRQYFHITEEE